MRVLVAPDKFKGTLAAREVGDAIAAGLEHRGAEVDLCPIADGGEGTAAVLIEALGGEWRTAQASDPLGRTVDCRFGLLEDGACALVEVAEASGLWRVEEAELNPLESSSRGTGELIEAAIEAGARRIMLACGGSATTDGGSGALDAFDPRRVELTCLCDTDVQFVAAATVFGPQKGADPGDVERLEARLIALAAELPHDPSHLPFTGAAGGLAGGLWAHGARLVSGAAHVLRAIAFDHRLAAADLVITGEGRFDSTSLLGKAVGEVAKRARSARVPCHAIVGGTALGLDQALAAGFASVQVAGTIDELRAAGQRLAEHSI